MCGLTSAEIDLSISPARISSWDKVLPCLKTLADDRHGRPAVVEDLRGRRPASSSCDERQRLFLVHFRNGIDQFLRHLFHPGQ
jgi:hypothetical protein